MKMITKDEAMYLRGRFGDSVYITKPTKHGKRYVSETKKVIRALDEYNKSKQLV